MKNPSVPDAKTQILYIQQNTQSFAGVEHVLDTICSELARKYEDKIEVDVLYTSQHRNRPPKDPTYKEITRLTKGRLDLMHAVREVVRSKPYGLVVVPQIEPAAIVMLACLGLPRKFAIYLHGNPHREKSHWKARFFFFLTKVFLIKHVAEIFGTSPKQLDAFRLMFASAVRQTWLPNPVRKFDLEPVGTGGPSSQVTFVNVGRFDYQKGQDILIKAFCEVCKQRDNVRLKLVGYGADQEDLQRQVTSLGLAGLVTFEHMPDSPAPALATSDVFVATSRWEGWSLAICEALRFGLPVISTDCEFGPSDILIDPRLGRLVEMDNERALVQAMVYYADHRQEEARHSSYRQDYIARFDVERVVDIHAQALLAATRGKSRCGDGTQNLAPAACPS